MRNAMPYTLKQAADATGKSKPTILRAIQSHKISAKKDDHGEWEIDPSELHRVYAFVSGNGTRNDTVEPDVTAILPNDSEALRHEIGLLREMLAERDKRVADKDAVIDDLRERLDREGEERRQAHIQLTALLTDQRTQAEKDATAAALASVPPVAPKTSGAGWWVVGVLVVLGGAAGVAWWVLSHPLPTLS
jgi:hypothetical protein